MRGSGINQGPVWSRDGARLAFTSNRSGSFGIWSVPIRNGREDGAPTQLKADIGDVGLVGFTAMGSLLDEQKIGIGISSPWISIRRAVCCAAPRLVLPIPTSD